MTRRAVARFTVVALAVVLVGVAVARLGGDDASEAFARDAAAYSGLGAWVDVFDWAPAFQASGTSPVVRPGSLAVMAHHGVRTLFLQAAHLDRRSPGELVAPELLGRFLAEAHERGVRVVGWYVPRFADVDTDLAHLRAIRRFEADGHRFDGVAVDIEWTMSVPRHAQRSRRLVSLSRQLRADAGAETLGAVVLPPVHLEVVNPMFWPDFPWRELSDVYDVWLPMTYWTLRTGRYADAYRYTDESIRRLRANLGAPAAKVHPIGGIGDRATDADYAGYLRAVAEQDAIGGSVYDFRTASYGALASLGQALRGQSQTSG